MFVFVKGGWHIKWLILIHVWLEVCFFSSLQYQKAVFSIFLFKAKKSQKLLPDQKFVAILSEKQETSLVRLPGKDIYLHRGARIIFY